MLARICKRRASSVLHTCICLQISHRAAQRPHRTLDELTTQLVEGGRLKREAKLAALRLEQQQAELAEISISVNSNSQRGAWSEVCKLEAVWHSSPDVTMPSSAGAATSS